MIFAHRASPPFPPGIRVRTRGRYWCPRVTGWARGRRSITSAKETRRHANAVNPAARATWAAQQARQSVGVDLIPTHTPGYAILQAYLPTAQGVAIMDRLHTATENLPHGTRGHAMVDLLTTAVTNYQPNQAGFATQTPAVPVTINLVLTDHTLFGLDDEPAEMIGHTGRGYGTIPAPIARKPRGCAASTETPKAS
ncbi:MAG: hypothetical protein FWG25_04175 [Promicromonosporaceae bacterium]|nr:hypothetical protein [Promicromonosporaceae bacterium]